MEPATMEADADAELRFYEARAAALCASPERAAVGAGFDVRVRDETVILTRLHAALVAANKAAREAEAAEAAADAEQVD